MLMHPGGASTSMPASSLGTEGLAERFELAEVLPLSTPAGATRSTARRSTARRRSERRASRGNNALSRATICSTRRDTRAGRPPARRGASFRPQIDACAAHARVRAGLEVPLPGAAAGDARPVVVIGDRVVTRAHRGGKRTLDVRWGAGFGPTRHRRRIGNGRSRNRASGRQRDPSRGVGAASGQVRVRIDAHAAVVLRAIERRDVPPAEPREALARPVLRSRGPGPRRTAGAGRTRSWSLRSCRAPRVRPTCWRPRHR